MFHILEMHPNSQTFFSGPLKKILLRGGSSEFQTATRFHMIFHIQSCIRDLVYYIVTLGEKYKIEVSRKIHQIGLRVEGRERKLHGELEYEEGTSLAAENWNGDWKKSIRCLW
jgi:hypothetical protein